VIIYIAEPVVDFINSTRTGLTFAWDKVAGVEGYIVYKVTENGLEQLAVLGADTTSYTDTTVKDGQSYTYAVASTDYHGNPGTYTTFTTTHVKPELKTLATPAVKIAKTTKGIKVTWNKIAEAETYIVYRRQYNKKTEKWGGWKVSVKDLKITSFVDTTVKPGEYYRYTVKAAGNEAISKFKSTGTLKYDMAPTVKAVNVKDGIQVTWTKLANATGYTVYSATYDAKTKKWSSWKNRGTAGKNTTSWTDKAAKGGKYNRYTVRAVYGSFKSSYKATGSVMRLAQPSVSVSRVSNGVKVKWSKVAGSKQYTVYRRQYTDGKWTKWTAMVHMDKSTSSWVDRRALKGVNYKYTVRAVNGSAKSPFVASATVKGVVASCIHKYIDGRCKFCAHCEDVDYALRYLIMDKGVKDGNIYHLIMTRQSGKFKYIHYVSYDKDLDMVMFSLITESDKTLSGTQLYYRYKCQTQNVGMLYEQDGKEEIFCQGQIYTNYFSGKNPEVIAYSCSEGGKTADKFEGVLSADVAAILAGTEQILKKANAGFGIKELGFVNALK
ncbi:MAG: hypothetical protein IKC01_03845, partial [Clostridia bacterium]|nr:hypothetical protein [Clostridia bacterium]